MLPSVEVMAAKTRQFKPVKPGMVHLPVYEKMDTWTSTDARSLCKEDSEIWRAFRRLTQDELLPRRKYNCNYAPARLSYPAHDGMKCMCYDTLMSIIRNRVNIEPPEVFRIPNRKPPRVTLEDIRPSWTRKALHLFNQNYQLQYPLPTVVVRWQLQRKLPKYDPETLKSILSPYGAIDKIQITSHNSCLVIFKDISTACRVIQARCLGDPINKLNCSWWHKTMANKMVYAQVNGVSVKTDHFIR